MTPIPEVLSTIAKELAGQAKISLPKLLDGEKVVRESFENGAYVRETVLGDTVYLSRYDFRQRKSRRVAVTK